METRRTIWTRSREAAIAAGAAMAVLLAGCSSSSEPDGPAESEPFVAAYLESYASADALEDFAARPEIAGGFDRVNVAFAVPDEYGNVQVPDLSDAYVNAVNSMGPDTELLLSIGGWSIANSRELMESNLRVALDNPQNFVNSAIGARDDVARQLGRDPASVGFALDFEWPKADEKDNVTEIVETIGQREPDTTITMAVPTGNNRVGFDLPQLAGFVDTFDVMTYDDTVISTASTAVAGYISPQEKVVAEIDAAVAEAGDASKVAVGFPAYGYRFVGATALGQRYNPYGDGKGSQVMFKDVPVEAIGPDGQAVVDGAVTSLVTPDMVRATMERVRGRHPDIGGNFVWTAIGTTPEFVDALNEK